MYSLRLKTHSFSFVQSSPSYDRYSWYSYLMEEKWCMIPNVFRLSQSSQVPVKVHVLQLHQNFTKFEFIWCFKLCQSLHTIQVQILQKIHGLATNNSVASRRKSIASDGLATYDQWTWFQWLSILQQRIRVDLKNEFKCYTTTNKQMYLTWRNQEWGTGCWVPCRKKSIIASIWVFISSRSFSCCSRNRDSNRSSIWGSISTCSISSWTLTCSYRCWEKAIEVEKIHDNDRAGHDEAWLPPPVLSNNE